MANPDFISLYFPELTTLAEADVLNARARLEIYLRKGWPDLDFRPNSPLGDMALTPFSYLICAFETAAGRFMSDLDLDNVSKGIIFNCDFTSRFLQNFAVAPQTTLQSSGIVRFTFITDAPNEGYNLDRGLQLLFGTDTFNLRLSQPGALTVLKVGSTRSVSANQVVLVELAANVYVADVPVVGSMTTLVAAGATGTLSDTISNLASVQALLDFDFGLPPTSLAELAQKTRQTFYSCTPNSRGGAGRFLIKEFPQLTGVSPVISGDDEMLRDIVNPLGFHDGRLDLYVRSNGTVTESQIITLPFFDHQDGTTLSADRSIRKFIGKFTPTGIPLFIDSIVSVTNPSLTLSYKIFSKSTDLRAPLASCAYTQFEELWIVVDMPMDGSTEQLLPENTSFVATYRRDPLLLAVSDVLAGDDGACAIDTIARGFIPLVVTSLTVTYTRQKGTAINLTAARAEILAYVNNIALPKRYSDARVADSLFYVGAEDVRSIKCNAYIQWSVADYFLKAGVATPDTNYATAVSSDGSIAAYSVAQTITNAALAIPVYSNTPSLVACGPRNVMIFLPDSNLILSEVSI